MFAVQVLIKVAFEWKIVYPEWALFQSFKIGLLNSVSFEKSAMQADEHNKKFNPISLNWTFPSYYFWQSEFRTFG